MKKILVPTDFSRCANNAMTFALELAVRTHAAIHVIHVIYPNEGEDNNLYDTFWIDEYFTRREHDLDHWVTRFRKNREFDVVTITSSCAIGFPAGTIKKVAVEQQADLIVMGTNGATSLRTAVMGSIAAGVVTGISLPVFAIPARAAFLRHTDYVLATDLDLHIDPGSLEMLKEVLQSQHAGIHILHVLNLSEERPVKAREAQIDRLLEGINHHFHYLHEVNIPRAISNFMDTIGAKGLIVVSHHHSFLHKLLFQRVSRQLTRHTRVPILVLQDKQT